MAFAYIIFRIVFGVQLFKVNVILMLYKDLIMKPMRKCLYVLKLKIKIVTVFSFI